MPRCYVGRVRREQRGTSAVEADGLIARLRIRAQHIGATTFREAHEVVEWLGAVQAQDYLGALWAVGLRLRQAGEAAVERAEQEREGEQSR